MICLPQVSAFSLYLRVGDGCVVDYLQFDTGVEMTFLLDFPAYDRIHHMLFSLLRHITMEENQQILCDVYEAFANEEVEEVCQIVRQHRERIMQRVADQRVYTSDLREAHGVECPCSACLEISRRRARRVGRRVRRRLFPDDDDDDDDGESRVSPDYVPALNRVYAEVRYRQSEE